MIVSDTVLPHLYVESVGWRGNCMSYKTKVTLNYALPNSVCLNIKWTFSGLPKMRERERNIRK